MIGIISKGTLDQIPKCSRQLQQISSISMSKFGTKNQSSEAKPDSNEPANTKINADHDQISYEVPRKICRHFFCPNLRIVYTTGIELTALAWNRTTRRWPALGDATDLAHLQRQKLIIKCNQQNTPALPFNNTAKN